MPVTVLLFLGSSGRLGKMWLTVCMVFWMGSKCCISDGWVCTFWFTLLKVVKPCFSNDLDLRSNDLACRLD